MKKYVRIISIVLIALVFIGTFVFLYQKSQPKPKEYEIITPRYANIEQTTVATGKVEPRDEVEIKPQISGIVAELFKKAGDHVTKGEVIARIRVIPDMTQLNQGENRVQLARINLAQATRDFRRMEKLYNDKLISAEDFEKSRVTFRQAVEERNSANDALQIIKEGVSKSNSSFSTTMVRSTITGLILDVPVKVGNSVIMSNTFNDGTTIATVANMGDIIFDGKVDETDIGKVYEGMPLKITIGALQDRSFPAQLEYVSPKAEEDNGANQFEIKAALRIPGGVLVRAGYSANATIILSQVPNTLTIPESAVEFQGDDAFVYVLKASASKDKTQSFVRRKVKVGISDGINIQVVDGISPKDRLRGIEKTDETYSARS